LVAIVPAAASCAELGDAVLFAVAKHCPRLVDANFSSVARVSDSGVSALASSCPELESACFAFCSQLTNVAVVALATHCPQLTEVRLTSPLSPLLLVLGCIVGFGGFGVSPMLCLAVWLLTC
jgi:hypothetical protein